MGSVLGLFGAELSDEYQALVLRLPNIGTDTTSHWYQHYQTLVLYPRNSVWSSTNELLASHSNDRGEV